MCVKHFTIVMRFTFLPWCMTRKECFLPNTTNSVIVVEYHNFHFSDRRTTLLRLIGTIFDRFLGGSRVQQTLFTLSNSIITKVSLLFFPIRTPFENGRWHHCHFLVGRLHGMVLPSLLAAPWQGGYSPERCTSSHIICYLKFLLTITIDRSVEHTGEFCPIHAFF